MANNLIPEICKMLGVELGEEFKVGNNSIKYWFDLDGLHSEECVTADYTLYHLVCGNCEIIKLPWKPKNGDVYYTFVRTGIDCTCTLISYKWDGCVIDIALLKAGWIYRTREEAQKALPKVAAEMGAEYEL